MTKEQIAVELRNLAENVEVLSEHYPPRNKVIAPILEIIENAFETYQKESTEYLHLSPEQKIKADDEKILIKGLNTFLAAIENIFTLVWQSTSSKDERKALQDYLKALEDKLSEKMK